MVINRPSKSLSGGQLVFSLSCLDYLNGLLYSVMFESKTNKQVNETIIFL